MVIKCNRYARNQSCYYLTNNTKNCVAQFTGRDCNLDLSPYGNEVTNKILALNVPELSSELHEFFRNKHQQRSALCWVITQTVVVLCYRRFGTTYRSHLLGIGPETSVRNYHHSLRNNPEERSSHILRGWSLKSCKHVQNSQSDLGQHTITAFSITVHLRSEVFRACNAHVLTHCAKVSGANTGSICRVRSVLFSLQQIPSCTKFASRLSYWLPWPQSSPEMSDAL